MNAIELRCPHCSTRLRLRDQSFVGRTVHCPDCTQPVAIIRTAAGVIEGVSRAERRDDPQDVSAAKSLAPPVLGGVRPRRIAWGLAGCLGVAIAIYALSGRPQVPAPSIAEAPPAAPDIAAPAPVPKPPPPAAVPEEPAGPQSLTEWVIAYRDRTGHYPVENSATQALAPDARLGWLAELAADREPTGPQPQWNEPLDSTLNSRFVRRRQDRFLLPSAPTSAAGYPATHYVGVAGVGIDAASLPKDHLRAGIFGKARSTTLTDIRDGAANTLLLVGVAAQPVPWAAGGGATIRGFTAEPYVGGPDGFGTGQPDGMFVALADGSVRFMAAETAPVIWRRMAAMADGWPLDPSVAGEPGEAPTAAAPVSPPADAPLAADPAVVPDPVADRPIDAQVAADIALPPPPTYDIPLALNQPIVRFSQGRAIPLRDLLRQVEELAGIPIQFNAADAQQADAILSREISLEVSDTTVGGILDAVLKKVGLAFETGAEYGVRIIPAGG